MEVRLASASTVQRKQEPEPETGMAGLFCFSISHGMVGSDQRYIIQMTDDRFVSGQSGRVVSLCLRKFNMLNKQMNSAGMTSYLYVDANMIHQYS